MQTAAERYALRLEERCRGANAALEQLRADAQIGGDMVLEFTDAIFEDFLLNNAAGACFVLQALPRRPTPAVSGQTVEQALVGMAKRLFAELLGQKTLEILEQHASFEQV